MRGKPHAIISIRPEFVRGILAGTKTVEVRRRFIDLPTGSTLWIYSTLPVGAIVAIATLSNIEHDTPNQLWKKYHCYIGILKDHFNSYFDSCSSGVALTLSNVQKITPLELNKIREIRGVNHIPQVAVRVSKHEVAKFVKISQKRMFA